jgi:hypothetical protein
VTTDASTGSAQAPQWRNVTPPDLPQPAQISSIEPSHVAKGTAYVTASRYMWDDFHPYVYETTDYGAHWSTIAAGLPADQFAFVIRQDPSDANLLFLGTKNTVYVSYDAGARWVPLALNLPKAQVRDLAIDTRQGCVVAATHGRAFWVLDNLALLEQMTQEGMAAAEAAPQVFAPQTAWLTHAYGASAFPNSGSGENPPFGAKVFFSVPASYDGKTPVTLTFSDASGVPVRTFALHLKTKPQPTPAAPLFAPAARTRQAEYEATGITAGANHFQWDLRYPDATEVAGFNPPIAAGGEEDDVSGPVVLPGTYAVTLDYGGSRSRASFNVALDPRIHVEPGALAARFALEQRIHTALDALDRDVNAAMALRSRGAPNAALDAAIANAVQLHITSSEGSLLHETKLRDRLAYLAADIDMAYDRPTAAQYAVFDELDGLAKAAQAKLASAMAQAR